MEAKRSKQHSTASLGPSVFLLRVGGAHLHGGQLLLLLAREALLRHELVRAAEDEHARAAAKLQHVAHAARRACLMVTLPQALFLESQLMKHCKTPVSCTQAM